MDKRKIWFKFMSNKPKSLSNKYKINILSDKTLCTKFCGSVLFFLVIFKISVKCGNTAKS